MSFDGWSVGILAYLFLSLSSVLGVSSWGVWNLCFCWESWGSLDWTGNYALFRGWLRMCHWLPCMLAWWGLLNLSGYDAYGVIKLKGAPGGKHGQTKHETSSSPLLVFLVSKRSLMRFWGCLVWHLWIGEARHPGPWDGSFGVEVFNIGGWSC